MKTPNSKSMKRAFQPVKTIIIGGAVFLVPVVVVFVVLGKAFGFMVRLAKALDGLIPVDSIGGVAMVNVLAVLGVLMCCFLAGVAARSGVGKRIFRYLEDTLLGGIPGYALIKGFTDSMVSGDNVAEGFVPVVARFDDNAQIAFEVERTGNGSVVIYLPGAPNPWSGSVVYMSEDRVDRLDMTVSEAIRNIRQLGRGSKRTRDQIGEVAGDKSPDE